MKVKEVGEHEHMVGVSCAFVTDTLPVMAAAAATRRGVILFIISVLLCSVWVERIWRSSKRPSIDNGACEVIELQ